MNPFILLFFPRQGESVLLWNPKTGLASNSQRPTCVCLLSAGTKSVSHYHPVHWLLKDFLLVRSDVNTPLVLSIHLALAYVHLIIKGSKCLLWIYFIYHQDNEKLFQVSYFDGKCD